MRPRSHAEWEEDQQRSQTVAWKRLRDAYLIPPTNASENPLVHATWDDYEPTAKTVAGHSLKTILVEFGETWRDYPEGLVILGGPGVGKTYGMKLLAVELALRQSCWVKFVTEQQWLKKRLDYVDLCRLDDEDSATKAFYEQYRIGFIETGCDVLFIDDVGKAFRAKSGHHDTELNRVLRERVALGKPTVISSNLDLPKFAVIDQSLPSFLKEVGEICPLQGKDHRGLAGRAVRADVDGTR